MVQHNIPFLLFMVFVFNLSGCHQENKGDSSNVGGNITEIEAYVARPQEIENTFRTPGNVLPGEKVELKAELPGRVVSINFEEGSRVTKGQLLVQIDDSELNAQLRKLEAQLRIAEADEHRKKELLSINGISQEIYDDALSTREQLEADIDLIQSRLVKSRIIAPFPGRVGLRSVSPGAYLSTGDVIATLAQTRPVKIEFNVPEKYTRYVVDGLTLDFKVMGIDDTFRAKVYAIEPSIDASSRTLKVRALSNNEKDRLIPGAYADLTLNFEKLKDVIMVPTQAIIPSLNSQDVFVVNNGKAKLVQVTTGIQTEETIQIKDGVNTGDTVAMTAVLALKEGMPVKVSKVLDKEITRR